ncbi:MAG: SpoIIE family protein phosphatase [Paracoccaceae bacterium]|nr:SpoIIE family protein phosphatase [Paracoccaceae bacterium]
MSNPQSHEYTSDSHTRDYPPLRALVVEDSVLQRRILATSLRNWGFDVIEAESGRAALDLCHQMPPDIVVSDWMMPEMNGLEFCKEFRAMNRETYGYFILLTSKGEKEEVALGLDCGADDFVTKPVNQPELRARISAGERILSMERQLKNQNKVIGETLSELTKLHDAIDRDLRQAKNIQHSLLPPRESMIQGSRFSAGLRSCGHVGGDLVGLFHADDGQIGMFNIDVSGHGITSALMTARISGYLSDKFRDQNVALLESGGKLTVRPPSDVAQTLNERLLGDAGVDQYFTMALATIDLCSGLARITQAGHPAPVLIEKNGNIRFLGSGGFPIGLLPNAEFDEFEITMVPNDRLLFCSDGLTEAVLENGQELGESGLVEIIQSNLHLSGRHFLDALYFDLCKGLAKGDALDDDISAVMLEYNSVETQGPH